jgi:pimeloyl-ACP methyl ester carboxylesterase
LVPGSELVEFPGASHGMHRSDPQGFASLVERAVELAPD